MRAEARPEGLRQSVLRRAAQLRERLDLVGRQALDGLRPDSGMRPGEWPAKRSIAISRDMTQKPSGFSASDATFATSLFGPMPIEQTSPVASWTAALTRRAAPSGARCRTGRGSLVEPDDLDARDVVLEDLHHPLGGGAVVVEVRRDERRLRHSRRARSAGVALKTPNLRAS